MQSMCETVQPIRPSGKFKVSSKYANFYINYSGKFAYFQSAPSNTCDCAIISSANMNAPIGMRLFKPKRSNPRKLSTTNTILTKKSTLASTPTTSAYE